MTTHLTDVSGALCAHRAVDDGTRDRGQLRLADQTVITASVRALEDVDPTVSVPEMRVLLLLSTALPDDGCDVADQLGVDAPEADRSCDRLVSAGHAVRHGAAADQRRLALTEQGRALAERLLARREQELAALVARMTEIDIRRLIRALESAGPADLSRSAGRR